MKGSDLSWFGDAKPFSKSDEPEKKKKKLANAVPSSRFEPLHPARAALRVLPLALGGVPGGGGGGGGNALRHCRFSVRSRRRREERREGSGGEDRRPGRCLCIEPVASRRSSRPTADALSSSLALLFRPQERPGLRGAPGERNLLQLLLRDALKVGKREERRGKREERREEGGEERRGEKRKRPPFLLFLYRKFKKQQESAPLQPNTKSDRIDTQHLPSPPPNCISRYIEARRAYCKREMKFEKRKK